MSNEVADFTSRPQDYILQLVNNREVKILKKGLFTWIKVTLIDPWFSNTTVKLSEISRFLYENRDDYDRSFLNYVDVKIRRWNVLHFDNKLVTINPYTELVDGIPIPGGSVSETKTSSSAFSRITVNRLVKQYKEVSFHKKRLSSFKKQHFLRIAKGVDTTIAFFLEPNLDVPPSSKPINCRKLAMQLFDKNNTSTSEIRRLQAQEIHHVEFKLIEKADDLFQVEVTLG
jgi:hypothetical protein